MKVRFCKHNKGKGRVVDQLEGAYPDLNVKVKDCIKKCGPCKKSPMAVVDGRTVRSEDGDDLFRNIVLILEGKGPQEELSLTLE